MMPALFCELTSAEAAIEIARKLTARGFRKLEAYTPYEVPELDAIVKRPRSRIPWAALVAGLFGLTLAYTIIWYCDAYDYPIDVGGRPLNSIPADIPIMFETAVLFVGLTTFFLVFARSGLPRLHHPIFEVDGFDRVSNDRYWIGIDTSDHDQRSVDEMLSELGDVVVHRRPENA